MTIVSADRTKAWEFWRCTSVSASGITTAVIVQWNLTGPGYSAFRGENTARGSGTPLISTSLTADEVLSGINHALGITVPRVIEQLRVSGRDPSDGSGARRRSSTACCSCCAPTIRFRRAPASACAT